MKGWKYEKFRWHDSDCYLLKLDLERYMIRPVMAKEEFPFRPQSQPVFKATELGALACVTDGFNIVVWNNQGVTDQPQHTLVVDQEIWTTGIGAGGFGYYIADGWATTQKNQIQIHVWRPDGTSIEVESVNLKHDKRVQAFTERGGTNSFPEDGHYYAVLGNPSKWTTKGFVQTRKMAVMSTQMFTAPAVVADNVVLEAKWPLKLTAGDEVKWTQHLGYPGVQHIVSGWPEILHRGENVVHNLFAVPSHGPDNWFVRKNPRTALGTSEDGKTAFLMVVQGRTPNSYRPHDHSKGLRVKELGTLMLERGAYNAVNMDGGGSAFLWLKDGGDDHGGTMRAPGCYNKKGTIADGRPGHYTVSIF